MTRTKIEWADAVWNPVTGCTKVSEGCRNCYAERMVKRFGGSVHHDRNGDFGRVICHADRLDQPLHWRKPRRVFVCSMGDLFHKNVPDEFIAAVFGVMAACPHHTFIVLTKRPNRMRGWFSWIASMGEATAHKSDMQDGPIWTLQVAMICARDHGSAAAGCRVKWPLPNVIGMVSAEDQGTADSRVALLMDSPFAVRGLSYEPALGPVDVSRWLRPRQAPLDDGYGGDHAPGWQSDMRRLGWVICGGESGPGARPMHPDWARSLRDQCAAAGVPFFFKQWGEWQVASRENGHVGSVMPNEGSRYTWLGIDGRTQNPSSHGLDDGYAMARVGKKAAGRELDGRTHNEFPEVPA